MSQDLKFLFNGQLIPPIEVYQTARSEPFMEYSTCSAADFLHPRFSEIATELGTVATYHRKLWEWVFVAHHMIKSGIVENGRRGLVFGVGTEMLPAYFAERGARILATDAPSDIGESWIVGNQFSENRDQLPTLRMSRANFNELVEFAHCDMNNIAPHLKDFDFCWSSCCLEHLGSLRAGMDFIINSVEKTLRVGGVACHTTEFNCSSNEETLDGGWCVLYRRRDIEQLVEELRDRGHAVQEFRIAPDRFVMDSFVDVPPYRHYPHLKLQLEQYVTTSVGLVVRRGR